MGSDDDGNGPKPKRLKVDKNERKLIVILENANIECVKNGIRFELLNCDKPKNVLKKLNQDPGSARPDITHQCLMMLLDSPLNRAGLLQVYIHTTKNVLIEVNPLTRIPRTYERFAGIMVQLLQNMIIQTADRSVTLLQVIENPISNHLPAGCKKIATSFHATRCIHPRNLVPTENMVLTNKPIAFIVGAMAHGQVNVDYTRETVSFSNYPLSAALTCSKLTNAFEDAWGVL